MARVNLLGGTYQARSIIADAQRCINLYPEMNPGTDQDHPVTHYPTPGTSLVASPPVPGTARCEYRASNGTYYRVVGSSVYFVGTTWVHTLLGTIAAASTPCSMSDNGLVVILVDGTTSGYAIDMVNHTFGQLTSPFFFGADKVDYLDTYFLFNKPGTFIWYISLTEVSYPELVGSVGGLLTGTITAAGTGYVNGTYTAVPLTGGTGSGAQATIVVAGTAVTSVTVTLPGAGYVIGDSLSADNVNLGGSGSGFNYNVADISGAGFDGLDFASKNGSPDPIVSLVVVHTEVWLIGQLTTEVWYNSGAASFTFQRLPGTFVEHGCAAVYSIAKNDLNLFWLSQDRQGQAIVVKSGNYQVTRISTHAIENSINGYTVINDAIGYTYQQEGHIFYVLTFPFANATWVWDDQTGLWHQRAALDNDGNLNKIRANVGTFVNFDNIIGDSYNGNILKLSLDTETDYIDGSGPNKDGSYPIPRIRAFAHIMDDAQRISYSSFIADMEAGNDDGTLDGASSVNPPVVSLRWSDDRGRTFGNKIEHSLGAAGQYLTSLRYNRLGYARDRVFELSWSAPARTALQGAFIEIVKEMS